MKPTRKRIAAGLATLISLCTCASITATQSFELSTEYVAMPTLPGAPNVAQDVALTANFGSCSKTALGNLEKLRADKHVDSLDVWVIVKDIELSSDATFSGIENLTLKLVTPSQTITVCDRALSAAEQKASTVSCPFEERLSAEQLCAAQGSSSSPTQMTIQLTVMTGAVTLTKIGATLAVETEVDANVSL
jgi:hypothetical protein